MEDIYNQMRYVGWDLEKSPPVEQLFDQKTINYASMKISELLQGVDLQGRKMVVQDQTIKNTISNIFVNDPSNQVGDIYTRYLVKPSKPICVNSSIIERAINFIVNDVRTSYGMIECNQKLNIWDTVYGDFNDKGLRAHPVLKINERKPLTANFPMMY